MNSVYKLLITKSKLLQESKMHRINLKKMQTQTREILSWFGPCDLRPVPRQLAWDFSYPDFDILQNRLQYTTWQKTLRQICTTLLYTKKTFSLMEYNVAYKPWNLYVIVNKISYRRTLKILHKGFRIVWRIESENSFLKNRIF